MGYAKDYSIPRVVIYDKQYDANNPMYDLNRQILGEDSNILLANRHNSSSVARDILLLKPKIAKKQPVQQSMF